MVHEVENEDGFISLAPLLAKTKNLLQTSFISGGNQPRTRFGSTERLQSGVSENSHKSGNPVTLAKPQLPDGYRSNKAVLDFVQRGCNTFYNPLTISTELSTHSCVPSTFSTVPVPQRPSSASHLKFRDMQAAVLQKEQCIQHTETVRTQKSKIEKLSTQLDQMKSEVKKLQSKLTDQQAATAEARVEADRRASLISTLAAESSNKDAMLRQLDSTLGRLTDGWQKREGQRNAELTEAKERERRLRDELDTVKKQLEDTQKSWEDEVKNFRNELQTATITAQEELARRTTAVNSLEMKASKLADRVGELKRTVERKEAEAEEYRKQLEQSKRGMDELRSQCIQLKTTWQQQINDARDALRREARFRRHELKKLQTEMQKAAETNEREKDELRQHLNKEYEQHLHDVLVGKDKEFQKQLMNVQENAQIALRDASDRYRMELEQLRLDAQNELAKHLNDAENRIDSERRRLAVVEKQMERWRIGAREAEEARSILVHRLNELLQSRCSEAIRLLHPQMTDKTKNMTKQSESAQCDENGGQKPLTLHHPMNVDELAELFAPAQPLPQAPLLLTNLSITTQSNVSQSEDETSSVTTESAVTQILNYQREPQDHLAPTAVDSASTELKVNNPVSQISVIADVETKAAY